ncbi:hypothetical protein Tco_0578766 [Tanacetum coccineum]
MARPCTQPKRPKNSEWFKEKMLLAQDQETDDLDAFDSECDEAPSASAILMAKLSAYDSDILSETLDLAEATRLKMNEKQNDPIVKKKRVKITPIDYDSLNKLSEHFLAHFFPQKQLSAEQAFWLLISKIVFEQTPVQPKPVQNDLPRQLPTTSMVKQNLLKAKSHLDNFEKVIKVRTKVTRQNERTSGFEHIRGAFEKDVIPFVKSLRESFAYFELGFCREVYEMKANFQLIETGVEQCYVDRREAHVNYLKVTKENADTLRDIVEQARASMPLDNVLDHACMYAKQTQELLVYVSATCPRSPKDSEKLVVVTPMNKNRQVSFERPGVTSKNNTQKRHVVLNANSELVCSTYNECLFNASHDMCVVDYLNDVNARTRTKSKRAKKNEWKPTGKVFTSVGHRWLPVGRTFTIDGSKRPLTRITSTKVVPLRENGQTNVITKNPELKVVQIVLWYLDLVCSKHMIGQRSQLINFVSKFMGTVRFGNDQVATIIGFGDYQTGNVTISRVYYVEGLGHNLFSVDQFCNFDLEIAFRKHTYFVRDLEGFDLLTGSRGTNLYTLSLDDMLKNLSQHRYHSLT